MKAQLTACAFCALVACVLFGTGEPLAGFALLAVAIGGAGLTLNSKL